MNSYGAEMAVVAAIEQSDYADLVPLEFRLPVAQIVVAAARRPLSEEFAEAIEGHLAELLRVIAADCGDGTTVCSCVPVAERIAEQIRQKGIDSHA